ncbi:MAG: TetR/AcrR family transcriptional regulator [Pegethrix bostrychoides GSE-TBD4-15B]|jgi:AcrR family transcriptional regulator|uniref:TetR/AcrR family transcriptional regulator n=1 Tax=Pegethrix bostrychoides GSE-TBD4-15B TaxID=2839662 RepID=A0A951P7U2_9CYAN|nr:TetR/AcrR family transcriptional regulator [Pegethrix bostrychoides GSE-TBD4-15B]
MSSQTTRQRLIQAALELFVAQGVSSTTTRQIAAAAEVNEVTLFRQFGNKYGLLLAVIQESTPFTHLGEALSQRLTSASHFDQALMAYASLYLRSLEQVPELIRSLIGEANQFPPENREALGARLTEATQVLTRYLAQVIEQTALSPMLPPEKLASLLNGLLLGYAAIEFTSEFHQLWQDREDFLQGLVQLFLSAVVAPASSIAPAETAEIPEIHEIHDLPAPLVQEILQRARKASPQDSALAYLLFATGLSPNELASLQRSQQISSSQQHLLQVVSSSGSRQVAVNQWIAGSRYGSYLNNPLTKWLKSRKDRHPALFIDENGQPVTAEAIAQRWQDWTADLLTPDSQPPALAQAAQTWAVEMLMRGMSLENLSILTGQDLAKLQPYARRAREKLAIEQAMQLDRRSPKASERG